jgi:putative thioredoxin
MTESPSPESSSKTSPASENDGGQLSPYIHDTTTETFEQDVVLRSQDVPVVIDFWAPSCDPCRQLTPLLEKLVVEADGRWHLVKVNIDDCQELAQALGVESIPLLVAFSGGQPLDSAPGLLTEEQLQEWLARFVPSEASTLFAQGDSLETTQPAQAAEKYREALLLEPDDPQLKIRLARVAITLDDTNTATALVQELEERGFLEPEAQALKDQLEITSSASETGGVAEARKAADLTPDDETVQLKLAETLAAERQFDEAFEVCLGIVSRDRDAVGQQARDALVTFFGMPTADPELVSATRRRLATLLY